MREQIKLHIPTLKQKMHIPTTSPVISLVVIEKKRENSIQDQEDADRVKKASRAAFKKTNL